jgi:acyl-CoA thioester hydrolase
MSHNICEFKVELGDTDSAGLVYYPNYFRWFDRAARDCLRVTGLTPREMLGKFHYDQPVVNCACNFYAPLRYDDTVRVETEVTGVLNKTFRLEHKVYCEGKLVATGYEIRAWVEIDNPLEEGKLNSVEIPYHFAEILRAEQPAGEDAYEDAILAMD